MQGNSRESTPQDLWKAQEDGAVTMASDEVRARANRYERESVLVYRVTLGLTPLFLFLFIYNLARLSGPLLLAGTGLALAAYCLIAGRFCGAARTGVRRLNRASTICGGSSIRSVEDCSGCAVACCC